MDNTVPLAEEALLRIGPGEHLDRVAALLEALARVTPLAPRLTRWNDVAELLMCGPRDRIVLDADHFPGEDIGIVRRFLASRPLAMLEAIGSDRTGPQGRAILALARTRWHHWPLDLVQLEALLRTPAAPPAAEAGPGTAVPTAAHPSISNGSEPRAVDLRGPLSDLSSHVRRANEALFTLRGTGTLDPAAAENLSTEIARIERTARSLALGAERNPRPAEEMDLDALVEEELAVLALQSRRAARVRYLGGEALPIRADRAMLVHTLTVLLDLLRTLANPGEPLEVRSLRSPADKDRFAQPRAIVRLRAPAGALAALTPAQLFLPGGLGEHVPAVGPNELCVLARLCATRGLELEARSLPGSPPQLEFDLSAPIFERTSNLLAGALRSS